MADYTKKLYIDGTDIIDIIKSEGGGNIPDVGTAGSAGAMNDITFYFHNGRFNSVTVNSISVPHFETDAKGRVISKGNFSLKRG